MSIPHFQVLNTYSIVAKDPKTGQLGVAVQTHQMGVGGIVPWLSPGIGALATQATVNIGYGPMGLAMLRAGVTAPKVVQALIASDPQAAQRQVAVVDNAGRVGAWTGEGCIQQAAHHIGHGYSVQANMMTNHTVVPAMAEAFEKASGNLADRMMSSLLAAQTEGGDIRGLQSAALKIVEGDITSKEPYPSWKALYDLRVDEQSDPLEELNRLVRLRGAQLLDEQGYQAIKEGKREEALGFWAEARTQAPELEELGFWQAVELADKYADLDEAIGILKPVLEADPRRDYWIELIRRIQTCGLIERPGTAEKLISHLEK
jgi:uncharacterized Ntn-hydrolase superfamily protein